MIGFAFFAGGEPASIAEQFLEDGSDSFDLDGASITFTPTNNGLSYDSSLQSITELPVDPSFGFDGAQPGGIDPILPLLWRFLLQRLRGIERVCHLGSEQHDLR